MQNEYAERVRVGAGLRGFDPMPGARLEDVAALLVAKAPAAADFNGIRIRARYATTRPADIIAGYHREMSKGAARWEVSAKGRKVRAEQAADLSHKQATMDRLVAALPAVPMDQPADVLAWVREAAEPADRIGVKYDHGAIATHFAEHGWRVSVNTGAEFDAEDARNFAGRIVGQWLGCRYPGVVRFCDDWTAKFCDGPAS